MSCLEKFFRKGPTDPVLKHLDTDLFGIIHFSINTFTNREWGYGYPEDAEKFNPTDFDADQIISACREGGLQGIVLVCKHHDGFCLWQTSSTDYNITKSPWRGGKGDIVREISDACHKYGLKFGVYVSPWDRNSAVYGTPEYLKIFETQIREVLTGYGDIFEMWFDGANGGDGWYGGADEKRNIGNPGEYYNWERIFGIVRELQPNARIFCGGPDLRWCGNERGHIPAESSASYIPVDFMKNPPDFSAEENYSNLQSGNRDDGYFAPPECDFPLRRGWFHHPENDGLSRTSLNLMTSYLNTVGNGGLMNIGISPDKRGRLTDEDCRKLKGFKERLDMLRQKKVFEEYVTGPGKHEIRIPGSQSFDVLELVEDIARSGGEKTGCYNISLDGQKLVEGNVIGLRRIRLMKSPVQGEKLCLEFSGKSFVKITGWLSGKDMLAPEENIDEVFHDPAFEDVTDKIAASDAMSVTLDFGRQRKLNGFVVTPDPDNRAGIPLRYTVRTSDDGKEWICRILDFGFDNILANPIPQRVILGSVSCRYLKFESFGNVTENAPMTIRAFAILKED